MTMTCLPPCDAHKAAQYRGPRLFQYQVPRAPRALPVAVTQLSQPWGYPLPIVPLSIKYQGPFQYQESKLSQYQNPALPTMGCPLPIMPLSIKYQGPSQYQGLSQYQNPALPTTECRLCRSVPATTSLPAPARVITINMHTDGVTSP